MKSDKDKKTHSISVKLTTLEADKLIAYCWDNKCRIASLVRKLINEHIERCLADYRRTRA